MNVWNRMGLSYMLMGCVALQVAIYGNFPVLIILAFLSLLSGHEMWINGRPATAVRWAVSAWRWLNRTKAERATDLLQRERS